LSEADIADVLRHETGTTRPNTRREEEADLLSLCQFLDFDDYGLYEGYFYGYVIPHISKEFDLLRIDAASMIDIEIKSTATKAQIKKQMTQNDYYLSFTRKQIHLFTYVSQTKTLYRLVDGQVKKTDADTLTRLIKGQTNLYDGPIDALFDPMNYLISPFREPEEFLKGRYFLTHQQEQFKKDILERLETGVPRIALCGQAGTGKTLLVYDIARFLKDTTRLLIVHCGMMNKGLNTLRKTYHWPIMTLAETQNADLTKYDVIIIDEAQRVHDMSRFSALNAALVYAYDSRRAPVFDADTELTLSRRIRFAPGIFGFIDALFDVRRRSPKATYDGVSLVRFEDETEAAAYIDYLRGQGWMAMKYEEAADEVFDRMNGREYDRTIVVIGDDFHYEKGRLTGLSEVEEDLLYLAMTRARTELCVVVLHNTDVYRTALSLVLGKDVEIHG